MITLHNARSFSFHLVRSDYSTRPTCVTWISVPYFACLYKLLIYHVLDIVKLVHTLLPQSLWLWLMIALFCRHETYAYIKLSGKMELIEFPRFSPNYTVLNVNSGLYLGNELAFFTDYSLVWGIRIFIWEISSHWCWCSASDQCPSNCIYMYLLCLVQIMQRKEFRLRNVNLIWMSNCVMLQF